MTKSLQGATNTSSSFETSDGVRLHYSDIGSGAPILFVPGWSLSGSVFDRQVAALSERYRIVVLDPRGQGASELTESGQNRERRAMDIAELLAHLDLTDATLVSWSMAVSESIAMMDQTGAARVKRLVLIDGMVKNLSEQMVAIYPYLRGFLTDRAAWTAKFFDQSAPDATLAERARLVAQSLSMPSSSAFALLIDNMCSDTGTALSRITVPVLFVYQTINAGQAAVVRDQLPQARLVELDHGGHMMFAADAKRFNAALVEFMEEEAVLSARLL